MGSHGDSAVGSEIEADAIAARLDAGGQLPAQLGDTDRLTPSYLPLAPHR